MLYLKKQIENGILIFLSAFISCSTKQTKKDDIYLNTKNRMIEYTLIHEHKSNFKALSNQFTVSVNFQQFSDSTNDKDSTSLHVYIKDKSTKILFDSIICAPCPVVEHSFRNVDSITSYSTRFNIDREIVDNYYGDLIVADLNFDDLDDLAIINDYGGNGGPEYFYYIQSPKRTFKRDGYLTDSVSYFPSTIDKKKKQLTTYVHAGACCMGEHVYQLDKTTNKWQQISHKTLGLKKKQNKLRP